jgi:hypothetical protein
VIDKLRDALLEIQGTCQEVAHEVEDPTQAVAEIEATTGEALRETEEPVVPLSEVRGALKEADRALTAWHADEPFYDPGSDSSEPFTQDAEFVTFIGHAVRDLLAAFPSTDSEKGGPDAH